jgi:hypothetical protein
MSNETASVRSRRSTCPPLRAIVGVQRIDGGTVTVLGEAAGVQGLRHKIAPNRPGHLRLMGTSWLRVPVR